MNECECPSVAASAGGPHPKPSTLNPTQIPKHHLICTASEPLNGLQGGAFERDVVRLDHSRSGTKGYFRGLDALFLSVATQGFWAPKIDAACKE